jgi:hypothetical protein
MLLRELYEQDGKTAVVAFGRLNPPTVGHAKLVDKIKSIPGDHFLFLSHTQKPKTDPLDFATKKKFAQQFFPDITIGHESVKTPVLALEYLQGQGYTDVIFVAGSDRVEGFQKLFDTYNGQPDKTGKIPFKFNSIRVVSAGERDPDADDVSGMSASKMRAAAAAGELQAFAQGVPDKRLAQTMYDAVRRGMGVGESVSEVLDTKAKDAKWTMSSEDMSRLEFTASNRIEYQIDFLAPYIGPDEIHPDDFIPDISGDAEDRSVFVEFSQKNATGAAKQGVAGTGAAAEIFGIVTNAILDFAKKRKPPMIYFQAAEVNRRKLYAAIVRRLVSSMSGYTAKQLGDKFAIYSRSLTNQTATENFADGKNPGRKGLAKRSGVNTKASVSSLRKTAKNSSGEKQRMAHWLANMKAGKAKKK